MEIEEISEVVGPRELLVELNLTTDVGPQVKEYLNESKEKFRSCLRLTPRGGMSSDAIPDDGGSVAVKYARQAKDFIRTAMDKYQCSRAHLFYAGPLGLAIFLGQYFNDMGEIQCYERRKDSGYQKSCLLKT